MPLFEGFAAMGFNQATIAHYAGVTEATVSRWADGKRGMEARQILFLTGLLRMIIETAEEGLDRPEFADNQKLIMRAKVRAAQVWLATQDEINEQLPAEAVNEARELNSARVAALNPPAIPQRRMRRRNEKTHAELGGESVGLHSIKNTDHPKKGGRRRVSV
jgi:transcriptional regulator with XRE-family HTH domain